PVARLPLLLLASGVAVAQAIHGTCALAPRLKWPNDVLLGDHKVSGAMAEASLEDGVARTVILGIGINANISADAWPSELRERAGSLLLATGWPVALPQLTRHLLQALERHCDSLTRGDSAAIVRAWRAWPNTLGQAVSVRLTDAEVVGMAEDIGDDGSLLLRLPNGDLSIVAAGDVSLRSLVEKP
ncbi:MAG: biotin--[acetyl-CoA-carboxylase] ligase, partial [Chloroflexota bacterium]